VIWPAGLILARTRELLVGSLSKVAYTYAVTTTGSRQEGSINAIATEAAFAALDDKNGVNDFIQRNLNDRQEFFNQAMARALKPIDSHANFVMMNAFHPAEDVIEHFRKNNILIGRHFPPMDTYIRVSLGRPEEMLAFW
jgi:histidinol-phosphate aminotransferase